MLSITERRKFRNYVFPAIIFLVGISISVYSYFGSSSYEDIRVREAFEEESFHDITSAVVYRLDNALSAVEDIAALFRASAFVSRREFKIYVEHELENNPRIQALEWIPYVPHEEREAYEAAAREDGLLDFHFTERHAQGNMVLREQQEAYFPVYYVEPLVGNEAAVGFDLASNAERLAALEQARDTGEMVVSDPITLVQKDKKQGGRQSAFLAFYPVYVGGAPVDTLEERRDSLAGFALGVFRAGDLLDVALEGLSEEDIHLYVYDIGAAEGRELIYEHTLDTKGHTQFTSLTASKVIDVAGRSWRLEFAAHPNFINQYKTRLPWTILVGGIILTGVISYALISSKRQTTHLEIQEAKFRSLLESAPDAMVVLNTQNQISLINNQTERLFQYHSDEIIGQDFGILCSGSGKNPVVESQDSGQEFQGNTKGVRKDGTEFPVSIRTNSFESPEGILIVCSMRDMSEIYKARRALEESEKRYQDIFEHASDMIQSVTPEGSFIFVNAAWLDTLGYQEPELKELTIWDIICPDFLVHCKDTFSRAMKGETIDRFEASFLHKDGTRVYVEGRIAPRLVDGQVVATHVFSQDVTVRRAADIEVKRVVDDLTRLIDTANAPIFGIDKQGLVSEWNQMVSRLTGYSKEEMLGRDLVEDYITEDHKASVKAVLDDALMGQETANYELPLYNKVGGRVLVLLNATARRDAQGNIVGVVGVGQDITEREQAETELNLLLTLAEEIGEAPDLNSALTVALRLLCEHTKWVFGEAWMPNSDETLLEHGATYHRGDEHLRAFELASTQSAFPPGVGLPGRVWSSMLPEWLQDVSNVSLIFCPKTGGVHSLRGSAYPRISPKNRGVALR